MSESNLARALWAEEPAPDAPVILSRPELRVVVEATAAPKMKKRRRPIARIIVGPGPFRLFRVW
jgi:hypothetical protein